MRPARNDVFFQVGQFTIREADTILAVEWDVFNKRVPGVDLAYPKFVLSQNLLLAKLYTRYFAYMVKSLDVCGIKLRQVRDMRYCVSCFLKNKNVFSDGSFRRTTCDSIVYIITISEMMSMFCSWKKDVRDSLNCVSFIRTE